MHVFAESCPQEAVDTCRKRDNISPMTHNDNDPFTPTVWHDVVATDAEGEPESGFGLSGQAFYDEVPVTSVWMSYSESLTLIIASAALPDAPVIMRVGDELIADDGDWFLAEEARS